ILASEPNVQFINTSSSNATSFQWNISGSESAAFAPAFTFPGVLGDQYDVCLIATDENGCMDEHCAVITVYDLLDVFVPNSFTPDGDGLNDLFVPIFNVKGALDYEFLVFDRWGELIFESEVPGDGWNGTFSGELVETEVYVWKLNFRDPLKVGQQQLIGHVTLLK
nr:gliding motility-associated C-terminal domain-containing protein [Bacteroidota bacterium]